MRRDLIKGVIGRDGNCVRLSEPHQLLKQVHHFAEIKNKVSMILCAILLSWWRVLEVMFKALEEHAVDLDISIGSVDLDQVRSDSIR